MGETERRIYRRQIKTTLSKDHELILDAICRAQGIKESEFTRDAIIEKLNTVFSDEVINEVKEAEIFQQIKGSLNQLMKNRSKEIYLESAKKLNERIK